MLFIFLLYISHFKVDIANLGTRLLCSAIDQFKNQFAHLEENVGKSGPVIPLERKHVSLPRYMQNSAFLFFVEIMVTGLAFHYMDIFSLTHTCILPICHPRSN